MYGVLAMSSLTTTGALSGTEHPGESDTFSSDGSESFTPERRSNEPQANAGLSATRNVKNAQPATQARSGRVEAHSRPQISRRSALPSASKHSYGEQPLDSGSGTSNIASDTHRSSGVYKHGRNIDLQHSAAEPGLASQVQQAGRHQQPPGAHSASRPGMFDEPDDPYEAGNDSYDDQGQQAASQQPPGWQRSPGMQTIPFFISDDEDEQISEGPRDMRQAVKSAERCLFPPASPDMHIRGLSEQGASAPDQHAIGNSREDHDDPILSQQDQQDSPLHERSRPRQYSRHHQHHRQRHEQHLQGPIENEDVANEDSTSWLMEATLRPAGTHMSRPEPSGLRAHAASNPAETARKQAHSSSAQQPYHATADQRQQQAAQTVLDPDDDLDAGLHAGRADDVSGQQQWRIHAGLEALHSEPHLESAPSPQAAHQSSTRPAAPLQARSRRPPHTHSSQLEHTRDAPSCAPYSHAADAAPTVARNALQNQQQQQPSNKQLDREGHRANAAAYVEPGSAAMSEAGSDVGSMGNADGQDRRREVLHRLLAEHRSRR